VNLLEAVGKEYPESVFAPEALWWLGVVKHVVEGDPEALADARQKILDRYPASAAALRV
jgi:hypothetical protein